jgi:hypothetical protein
MQSAQEELDELADMMTKDLDVPVGPDKTRTTVTLPKQLMELVKLYRFDHHHESLSDALAALIEHGLDAVRREEQEQKKGRRS